MDEQGDPQAALWRPLHVRGIPVHFAAPALALIVGLALLAGGGVASVLGAWVLTAGFPLAVGAFVADPRAMAAPSVVWAGWLIVVQLAGSGSDLPRTPLLLAVVLAGLGAAAVWLAQRAVLPAVEGAEPEHARSELPDLDALLAQPQVPPLLDADANAEVDEALAELLDEPIDEAALEAAEAEADADADVDDDSNEDQPDAANAVEDDAPDAEADDDTADAVPDPDDDDDETDEGGHVIEFEAIRED